ncbi:putative thioesterase superfamily member 2 [Fasciola gigantica]|uniref:Putative thioesterase superfamily member 2 n=1 Tax=Fasciola gigantica TaxID=46835 RepID=A0A504YLZ0_FASGI|nr:putative thioesterase superfamily member 2 [Fasciola gigantica]
MASRTSLPAVNRIIAFLAGDKSFNRLFRNIEAVAATEKCLTCRFLVSQAEANSFRTLHGGYITGAVDFVSSVDLIRLGHRNHVSVHLGVDFMKPGKYESWIKVESYVQSRGKRLAFCDVLFTDEETGKLLAKGTHTKYLLPDDASSS